jgi:uncharacterized alpha-E superfamily protein
MELLGAVRRADIVRLAREYAVDNHRGLHRLLDHVIATLPELSDAISHHYFFHSGPIQRLAELDPTKSTNRNFPD